MDDEESTTVNNSVDQTSLASTNPSRSHIRRGIRRQTITQRLSPYNSNSSNLRRRRRRQRVNTDIPSIMIDNLISHVETAHSNELNVFVNNQDENEVSEEIVFDGGTSDDDDDDDQDDQNDFQVLVDFSHSSPIDLTLADGIYLLITCLLCLWFCLHRKSSS